MKTRSMPCASPGDVRNMMPPTESETLTSQRMIGMVETSRSRTSMALAVSALITARLNALAAREASRATVTRLPLRSVVA